VVQLSNLINSLPPFHFADAKKRIEEKQAQGVDVVDLSVGDPDLPAPPSVIERLCETAHQPINHRYPEYRGMHAFHDAVVSWFQRRFGVALEPERETLALIGSKEGLVYAASCVLNAGDIALTPDPYYPVYVSAATTIGAQPYMLPLREENRYLMDLDSIPADVLAKARLLWLNYPNNPTAAVADLDYFASVVEFAKRHQLVIVHDMAYAETYYDDFRPPSLLQVPGAMDVAVELHSLSKTYNMPGFRVGMLVGNATLVDAVARLKSNIDSGIFRPVQYAAIEALNLPEAWTIERNAVYKRRRDLLVEGCNTLGMRAVAPLAGLYIWARIPEGYTSREFSNWLFDRIGVFITPGSNFGPAGEGYVRISLTTPDERIAEALRRIRELMAA